jgi:hypothetical protein
MPLGTLTTDDIRNACQRALEAKEGSNYYSSPYPITLQLLEPPYKVIYWGADNKSYARAFTLTVDDADAITIDLGERVEVESRTVWLPLDGAAPVMAAFVFSGGNYAERKSWTGLIFRAGRYPDKCGEVTADNLRAIVANFPAEGVPVIDTHYDDTFMGALLEEDSTRLVRVWTENDDTELHGEMSVPGWLAFAARNVVKKVSVGLTAGLNALREISLVLNPRVVDAAVFHRDAAIAFSMTPEVITRVRSSKPALAQQINELAKATKEAPATPLGPEVNHMNFSQQVRALWASLTPEIRAASGLTDADINNDSNFVAAPAAPDVNHLAFARARAGEAFAALLQERKVTPAMKPAFLQTFTGLLRAEGNGAINFSATDGSIVEGESVKAFLALFTEVKPQFNVRETLIDSEEQDYLEFKNDIDALEAAMKSTSGVGRGAAKA